MFRAVLRRVFHRRSLRRLAFLYTARSLLLLASCDMPMGRFLENGPTVPGPLSSGLTPPLQLTSAPSAAPNSSVIQHTVHHEGNAPAMLPNAVAVNFDSVLHLACERNPEILAARERVTESQAAFEAAIKSCMPEMLRKDTFKRSIAEAQLWRRRGELRKVQTDKLQDAADTYIDILAARRGEVISRDLLTFEQKLLDRARKLAASEKPAKVIAEAAETAYNNQQQLLLRTRQQGDAATVKLAYLLGMNDGVPAVADQTLAPVDLVDAGVALSSLVKQAEENGPGVAELHGLIAAIEQGIADAWCAQRICNRTGAALVCGRLQMAQSQLQQAQLALVDLHGKLRAGVEEAVSAILSGREQIPQASAAIGHAAETYRLADELLKLGEEENRKNKTYNLVLTSIQQLAQVQSNYLTAVRAYNKAQVRLLLLIGTYNDCQAKSPCPADH
ncbi:MAG TPA: TolC family protein [Gemmataceae bacterium]|jgi:outer membrane protein TolC